MSYSNLFNLEQECPELEILIKTSLKIFFELSKYLRSFIKKKFLVYFFFFWSNLEEVDFTNFFRQFEIDVVNSILNS